MDDELTPQELFIGAIKNTGLVSVLLAGESGTGKTYTIESVLEELKLKRRAIPALFAPATVEDWQNLLGELVRKQVKVLIIDHIEDMPHAAQTALFHEFSNCHGQLCRFPDAAFDLRMVFTTVKSVEELRSNADIIMPHVYDRMSQLIIRFKQLQDLDKPWERFKEVWKALNFREHNELPKEQALRKWIENNLPKMNGNYRDLEKIAIRWHNRRLLKFTEDRILDHITKEYREVGFGAEPESEGAAFSVHNKSGSELKWAVLEAEFKRFIRKWAEAEKGSKSKAAEMLDVSVRTLERWN